MASLVDKLVAVGLSAQQARVYLACLELGGGYASSIARRANLARVNGYYILNQLRALGLVSLTKKGRISVYVPETPRSLHALVAAKLTQADQLLPDLLALTNSLASKPTVRFYEGREGVRTIFEDLGTAEGEVLSYSNLEAVTALYPDFLRASCAARAAAGSKTRIIAPHGPAALHFARDFFPTDASPNLLEIFAVQPQQFHFENDIALYGNKAAIISLNANEIFGLLIESASYVRTQTAIYNLAWLGATSFVAQ